MQITSEHFCQAMILLRFDYFVKTLLSPNFPMKAFFSFFFFFTFYTDQQRSEHIQNKLALLLNKIDLPQISVPKDSSSSSLNWYLFNTTLTGHAS